MLKMESFNLDAIKEVINTTLDNIIKYGLKVIVSLLILWIGFKIIKIIGKMTEKAISRSKLDDSLTRFIVSTCKTILKVLLIVFLVEQIGVGIMSLMTVVGAAGLTLGLALQGSLSNFVGGFLILYLKPFTVNDYILETSKGHEGTVEEIDIFYTTLRTFDNKVVVIPNGNLSNNSITNYTKKDMRRIDLKVSASYNDEISKVREALFRVANRHEKVLKEPEAIVRVDGMGDNAIHYLLLAWAHTADFITTKSDLFEMVKQEFDASGISIPFPQLDVHMKEMAGSGSSGLNDSIR